MAAVLRALVVNSAAAAIKGSAGLSEKRCAGCGARRRSGKAERAQAGDVIAALELYIGEDNAVAAHSAFQAEVLS